MSTYLVPDLRPSISGVRAVVTTKWGKSSYRPIVIHSIESYYVDTAMDNDADTWTLSVGDPYGEFLDTLKRDSEVRVQLFGAAKKGAVFLMTGIADEIEYDETGTLVMTGRDLSSIAIDSYCPPFRYEGTKAWTIVEKQAKEIGFKHTNLSRGNMVKKLLITDGNETYWEFWYRLYRREKMWLWTEPTGMLVGSKLNYSEKPTYHFGTPLKSEPRRVQALYIPVVRVDFRKSTQSRVWEVWVYYQKGDNGGREISKDPTMAGWMKKPRRILQDTEARTSKSAQKLGWEEIFEGKVGSIELKITIPDPGYPIKPNRTAIIRVPELGITGDFYVVGVRYQAGPEGFVQEVRLREKQYAISRRVPKDPKLPTSEPKSGETISDLALALTMAAASMPEEWGQYFVDAAKEFNGQWDYNLFLATLVAICDQETGGTFTNIRANGGPGGDGIEWYPWEADPLTYGEAVAQSLGLAKKEKKPTDSSGRTRDEWEEIFANQPGRYTNKDWAVGPMQLYSEKYKHWADDHFFSDKGSANTGSLADDIDAYITGKQGKSPLIGHGADFVASGKRNGVDPRFIVAISGGETSFATDPGAAPDIAHFNAWGIGPGDDYSSWEDGIEQASWTIGQAPSYYIQDGNISVAAIGSHWAPTDAANDPNHLNKNWVPTNSQFLREQGGNPDDVRFSSVKVSQEAEEPKPAKSHDEYSGGRWHPQHNIWAGAKALREKLDAMVGGSNRDVDMWAGVSAYGHHAADEGANTIPTRYAIAVKNKVYNEPGYLAAIKDSVSASRETQLANQDGQAAGVTTDDVGDGSSAPTEAEILNFFNKGDLVNP